MNRRSPKAEAVQARAERALAIARYNGGVLTKNEAGWTGRPSDKRVATEESVRILVGRKLLTIQTHLTTGATRALYRPHATVAKKQRAPVKI